MSDPKFTSRPWKLVRREVMEDGSVYPTHIVCGPEKFQVCILESSVIAKLAIDNPSKRWGISDEISKLLASALDLFTELQNIANAKPEEWDEEMRDQFREWAQSRARAALAKATGA